jgi:hypothetical protein
MARPAPAALRLIGDAAFLQALTDALAEAPQGGAPFWWRQDDTTAAPALLTASTPQALQVPLPDGSLQLLCATPDHGSQRAALQAVLLGERQPFGLALGDDLPRCLEAVRRAWHAHRASLAPSGEPVDAGWRHACARCGDGDCERRLFRALIRRTPSTDEPND